MDEFSFAQKQRLAYIDFKLYFTGMVTRSEIVSHFELGLAAATRDLKFYKDNAPENMAYDNVEKKYFITTQFKPIFKHDARRTLIKLANNISDGFDSIGDTSFPIESPSPLNVPDIDIIAKLSQAIINQKPISVIYTSLSSGSGARELVPHSIVDNGLRWHLRAYDRKSKLFRDFVLTRITKVTIQAQTPSPEEDKLEDHQWMRMVPLQIIPHPNNVKHPTAIKLDFGMEKGMLEVNVRAAMAGYLLRRWNVDCSESASLSGPEYQLYLQNIQTLYGAENLAIAPGYQLEK
ncbi:WYL domain-containing protein [Colwellia sp. M166]|uniref:WYL domain-containing protein n=1 Tax=Colwellia sp. M166 TaxID=2583805 RepID=UPI00211F2F37|nr:WYL domain-containing protein [Colwellia sp. M166]UUO22460.1 WYL domain-containing protein [Colwellia sp. M166]|tara:strand:+ start:6275 stop:7147 length:873 start_codon:yes stop_codon:yes gene_type:complete